VNYSIFSIHNEGRDELFVSRKLLNGHMVRE
jgi:hypothetical protein